MPRPYTSMGKVRDVLRLSLTRASACAWSRPQRRCRSRRWPTTAGPRPHTGRPSPTGLQGRLEHLRDELHRLIDERCDRLRRPSHARPQPQGVRSWSMARRSDHHPIDPAVVAVNPDEEVTPEAFTTWLDQLQSGEPIELGVTAAQTLAEARAAGEV